MRQRCLMKDKIIIKVINQPVTENSQRYWLRTWKISVINKIAKKLKFNNNQD